ncbi:hypothetical protein ZMTM_24480 [Methyloradius palustris]|uniref:Uncharacterized protein n=1 Tax=Methyloradius palustris TaxID=2778876 RepID=A0A8D5JXJ7_9PROT|nr:hypothetical protein ZMTM_24480 [Methyloradius palustris]
MRIKTIPTISGVLLFQSYLLRKILVINKKSLDMSEIDDNDERQRHYRLNGRIDYR